MLERNRRTGVDEDRHFFKSVGQTCTSVTAQEKEGQPPAPHYLGNWLHVDALQTDVEDREIIALKFCRARADLRFPPRR